MVDLDEEFARFAAELKSVEEAVKPIPTDEAATAQLAPPPLAPPPVAPPPQAQAVRPAKQQQTAAAAPPLLVPPPVLLPPPVLSPPPAAARPPPAAAPLGAYGGPAAGMGFAAQQQQQQLPYMGQQMAGYHQQQQQQQSYGQPDPQQLAYPPPPAAASNWPIGSSNIRPSGGLGSSTMGSTSNPNLAGLGSGLMLNPSGLGLPLNPHPNAPADPETLKRLKEELVQQKQADKAAGGAGDKAKSKAVFREAAGKRWIDPTMQEWPDNDFRIFVGDLGNEVNDDVLGKAFQRYPSFAKAKIIRDKRTNKSKGFGIVSLLDGNDFAKALKEMNGKYIGNRPCKLSRSTWNERGLKGSTGGGGFGSGHTKGSNKRKDAPAPVGGAAGPGGSSNKVQKAIPKFKYHVPIMR